MPRDLSDTDVYRAVAAHFRRAHEPGFGRISGASDPAASPDGCRVAFTGTRWDALEGEPVERICVIGVDGGELEPITFGPNNDRSARWSPRGDRLAFASDRRDRGRFELLTLEADRISEARPVAAIEGTVEDLRWSPSGDAIVVVAAGLGAELAGVQGSGATGPSHGGGPSWMPEVRHPGSDDEWRRAWRYDLATGSVAPASRAGLNVWECRWAGPGALAAVVSEAPDEAAWYSAALALLHPATGAERVLYRSDVQLGVPAASPSGERIAVIEAIASDRCVLAGDVLLFARNNAGAARLDARGVDVTHVEWIDEDRLLVCGLRGLKTVVAIHDVTTGSFDERWTSDLTCGGRVYPSASAAGGRIAVVVEGYGHAPEVAVIEDGAPRRLSALAHEGSHYVAAAGGSAEAVAWTAPDGIEIEGLLCAPPGAAPHPLVLLVHGGPVGAFRNQWAMGFGIVPLLVSRGYAVLCANPRGSSGRGRDFIAPVVGDMGGADVDDLLSGIDALVARGIADPARLGVMGGSYGGFMTALLVTRTDRFAAAVAASPVTNWYSQHFSSNIAHFDRLFLGDDPANPGGRYFERSPVFHAATVRTPTLVTAGARDRCTPPGQAVEFHQAVAECGVDTELVVYPEEGHGVRKQPALTDWCARMVAWFERYMPARAD